MERRIYFNINWILLAVTALISLIGLANLYSATYNLAIARYFNAQILWLSVGLALMLISALIDYRLLYRAAYPLYAIGIGLLAAVLMYGRVIAGSKRWLHLGPVTLQPSEIMKILIIIALARLFHEREVRPPYGLGRLIAPVILTVIPLLLIFMEPDLGTSIIIGVSAFSLIVFVGVNRRVLAGSILVGLLLIPIAWFFLLNDYQKNRVITFMSPEKYALEGGYQAIQSKIAIGSGQFAGKGWRKGTQSQLLFLPKQHTDFVFANFAEEWGFMGSAFVLALYLALLMAGLDIVMKAKERFGAYLAFGLVVSLFWQISINIAMELGLMPVVGLPLPLMSYGGSSIVTTFLMLGLLQNISMRRYLF